MCCLPYDQTEACSHRWLLHWTQHRDVASSNWGLGSNITLPPPFSLSGSCGISSLGLVGSVSGSRVISLRVPWDLFLGLIGPLYRVISLSLSIGLVRSLSLLGSLSGSREISVWVSRDFCLGLARFLSGSRRIFSGRFFVGSLSGSRGIFLWVSRDFCLGLARFLSGSRQIFSGRFFVGSLSGSRGILLWILWDHCLSWSCEISLSLSLSLSLSVCLSLSVSVSLSLSLSGSRGMKITRLKQRSWNKAPKLD